MSEFVVATTYQPNQAEGALQLVTEIVQRSGIVIELCTERDKQPEASAAACSR